MLTPELVKTYYIFLLVPVSCFVGWVAGRGGGKR